MKVAVSAELKNKLSALHGVAVDDVFFVQCAGQALPDATLDGTELALASRFAKLPKPETAGGPSLISNGVPTIMRIVSWMCHEGINDNRLGFVREELPAAAAKIAAPNLLVMDWNHSAVKQYDGDQRIIGVWYKADYAFDPKAKGGAGAWGILTTGIMWSWANPEIANAMLAEQERNGHLDFSMACIGTSTEYGIADDGRPFQIAHNPIFFTNSALDVKPADTDATGHGAEGSDSLTLEDDVAAELTGKKTPKQLYDYDPNAPFVPAGRTAEPVSDDAQMVRAEQEEVLMEELRAQLAALEAQLAEQQAAAQTAIDAAVVAAVETATVAAKAEAVAELTAAHEATVAELNAKIETLTAAQAAVVPGTDDEQAIAREALETERAALADKLAAAEAALAAAQGQLDSIEAEKAAATKQALIESRIASLPGAVKTAYEKRSEDSRAKIAEKWAAMSEDEWAFYLTEELGLNTAAFKVGYVARSEKEGVIPTNASEGATSDIASRVARLKK